MSDILDQNEVDALLKGVAAGDIETETDEPVLEAEDIRYDLTNPERIVRDKMTSLTVIHDKFVKSFQNSLSALLRKDVEIQILSFDVMKYVRFIETVPLPASLSIMRVDPHHGVMILELDAKFVFTAMDILCGGSGSSRFKVEGRDFTSIEHRVIGKIVTQASEDLVASWKPVVALDIVLEKTEVNPRFVTAVDKSETLVVYTFEVEIEQVTCTLKLCIPYATIEPFRGQLSGESTTEKIRQQDRRQNECLTRSLKEMPVTVAVEVGQGDLTFRELMSLQVGDVITLDTSRDGPFSVKCEGVRKFRGYPGQYKGKMAVQVI